ncbi:MAG: SseB family protein [Clostridiales bacterium]|nr:SseB family protein [Clostridiales bacterium]
MNRSILMRVSYNLNNAKLEELIAECQASKNDLNKLNEAITLMKRSQVIIPVAFPKGADPRAVMKLMNGQPLKKNEAIRLIPVSMTDKEGHKFHPIFTSREKILDTKDFPFMIRVSAGYVIENIKKDETAYDGMIVNPQQNGLIIRKKAFIDDLAQMAASQPKAGIKKVTKAQFTVLARSSVEKVEIPRALFERKGGFIDELEERGEEFICELYGRPYGEKTPSPFTPEDFNVLSLNINEETAAYCIELPRKGLAPHIATNTYIIWNPVAEQVYYYMIEKGEKDEDDVLCCVTPDGKHEELMTAPPNGSELTAVLDLIHEDEE